MRIAPVVCLLFAGLVCEGEGPSTRSYVYNLTTAAFALDGHAVEKGASRAVFTANGATDTIAIVRGSRTWHLVIKSLLPAEDPSDYDAAVNVHEDVADSLYCREYSPYIEAEIIGQ